MKILFKISLLTSIIAIVGCINKIPKTLSYNFTYKYTDSKKELNDLIHLDGYYSEMQQDDFYMNYLFFSDGLAIQNLYGSDRSSSPDKLPDFLINMAKDTTNEMKLLGRWGTYILSNDTIKAQFIHTAISLNDGWSGWEKHFKVINKETLQLIYLKPLHHLTASDKKNYTKEYYREILKNHPPAIFIKAEAIPNPNCWMKKKKWFWEDETAYNNYMNQITDR